MGSALGSRPERAVWRRMPYRVLPASMRLAIACGGKAHVWGRRQSRSRGDSSQRMVESEAAAVRSSDSLRATVWGLVAAGRGD